MKNFRLGLVLVGVLLTAGCASGPLCIREQMDTCQDELGAQHRAAHDKLMKERVK